MLTIEQEFFEHTNDGMEMMTQSLQSRPRAAADLPSNLAMTCDVPVVLGRRAGPAAAVGAGCRPTGRSPESHRRGVRIPLRRPAPAPVRAGRSNTRDGALPRSTGAAEAAAAAPAGRRRRMAGTAAGLLVGLGLAAGFSLMGMVGDDYERAVTGSPAATEVVHVRSGESLSALAARIAPDRPPAAVIATVRDLNGLTTSGLRPGQALVVPAYR